MDAIVTIQSGINVVVSPQAPPQITTTVQQQNVTVSNLQVLGFSSVDTGWLDANYYPRSNPDLFQTSGEVSQLIAQAQFANVQLGQSGVIEFSTDIISGIESQRISFPLVLATQPKAVNCNMVNDMDNIIYDFVLSSVNTSGFTISFSDNITTTGYKLYTIVGY